MFKKLFLALALVLSISPAYAGIVGLNNPQLMISPPTTLAGSISLTGCQDYSLLIDTAANIEYIVQNCAGTYALHQFWPPVASEVTGLNTAAVPESGSNLYFTNARAVSAATAAGFITSSALTPYLLSSTAASTYFAIPTGSSTQYLDGTGTPKNFTASSRTFSYPSRALASCFQISATQDANFVYSVDITAGLISLGGGTGLVTSYTNSGCTTGAQAVANGAVSSVALSGTSSIPLSGILPAGKWVKVTGAGTGGGTATIDAVQAETLLP